MKLKLQFGDIPACRIGLQSLTTREFICPKDRFPYLTEYGGFFYLANNDIIDIPDDNYEVFISTGSRFLPTRHKITCSEAEMVSINVEPEPFKALQNGHWYDTDLHIHGPNRDEPTLNAIVAENIPQEIIAENMSFACVVDRNGETVSYGHAQKLIQTHEYRNGAFGHYLFLGGAKPLEHQRDHYLPDKPYPLPLKLFGQAKHNGATIIAAHPITHCEFDNTSSWPGGGYARGLLALLAAGLVDAISIAESSSNRTASKELWYHLLNLGLKIPAVVSGDICLRAQPEFPPVGTWRTLTELKGEINFERFLSQIRKGRSLMSTGPVLKVDVDGYQPGDCIDNQTAARTLNITMDSPDVVDNLKVIVDGEVVKDFQINSTHWQRQEPILAEQGSWLAVECSSSNNWHYPHGLWAHTNPIFLLGDVGKSIHSGSTRYIKCFVNELESYLLKRSLDQEEHQSVMDLTNRILPTSVFTTLTEEYYGMFF